MNKKYASYLVCNEHIEEVRDFLAQFFDEQKTEYNFEDWVTFVPEGTNFVISLMGRNSEQPLTQNMTFEITCKTLEELEEYAEHYGAKVESFPAKSTPKKYTYYYVEIPGPAGICKMEINYMEDLKE